MKQPAAGLKNCQGISYARQVSRTLRKLPPNTAPISYRKKPVSAIGAYPRVFHTDAAPSKEEVKTLKRSIRSVLNLSQ